VRERERGRSTSDEFQSPDKELALVWRPRTNWYGFLTETNRHETERGGSTDLPMIVKRQFFPSQRSGILIC
jgi:hypothetical protein